MTYRTALVFAALAFGGCSSTHASAVTTPTPTAPAKRIVGYYYGPTAARGFPVSHIQGSLLTHINYAFAQILSDGSAALGSPSVDTTNFADLLKLKQRYPHLQILISFGGWGGSKYFSTAAGTSEARARFSATTLATFFQKYPGVFDGVDLDWEYPVGGGAEGNINTPQDRENFTALVQELRRALDTQGKPDNKHYLITIAAPAGMKEIAKFEMDKLGQSLDFINVMSYDYHTGGKVAHFNAPLSAAADDPTPAYNVATSVEEFLRAGVPASKLVVGVPFYGYGYAGVAGTAAGRFQAVAPDPVEPGAAKPKFTGAVRFNEISGALKAGFQRHWDQQAGVPWLYNPATRTWITYDDAQSLGLKADLVRTAGLGGMMIWELSGDDGTLLPMISKKLRGR